MFKELKRTLVGLPIASTEADHQRLSKKRALAVFSSDALSSVAYATEAILYILVAAGGSALGLSIPISIAIIALLALVVTSYKETIHEYPGGGGAYTVARENLGETAGLLAGAALLVDYVLTVAVSVSAGVEALTSALPLLHENSVLICLIMVGIITLGNLRGLKESAAIFALPTYFFIGSMVVLLLSGFFKLWETGFQVMTPPVLPVTHQLTVFFILKAFSSGCTAMTGVEAISNGVPAFRYPGAKNASITLKIMAVILGVMFLGTSVLAHYFGIVPAASETVLSQIARAVFGRTYFYYIIQAATMLILVLAANTSYADFPRLASLLAKDRYLPRQLASLGDRLVFSNGILILGFFSSVLIILFQAETHALIPLYAVGVFLSFSLSQSGMVRHWMREQKKGWLKGAIINAVGGTVTTLVFIIFVVTKFSEGAWTVIVILPCLIFGFLRVHKHYLDVGRQLNLDRTSPELYKEPIRHTVILPISGIHRGVVEALRYAESIGSDVRAVYVEIDHAQTEIIQSEWTKWGRGIPLVVLKSPYRSVITPLLNYIDEIEGLMHDDLMTIIVPEFVAAKWWQQVLHNQTAMFIRTALIFKRGKIVTSVRYHLK